MPRTVPGPRDRVCLLALRTLEDVLARAPAGEVERTWGHRLALEILVRAGIANRAQAAAFWLNIPSQEAASSDPKSANYIQSTALYSLIGAWRKAMGMPWLCSVEIAGQTRAYLQELDFGSGTQQLISMCNRYRPGLREDIQQLFSTALLQEVNEGPTIVHPRDPAWVVRVEREQRVLEQMSWGFPVHVRGRSGQEVKPRPVNNARIEKLGGYWKYWAAQPAQRCLIPAVAYAEAVGQPGRMTTTWLSVKDAALWAWAGLWRDSPEWGRCYTGVMTVNAPELGNIHDRAPVILKPEDWDTWLHAPLDALHVFKEPWPAAMTIVRSTTTLWKHGGEPQSMPLFGI